MATPFTTPLKVARMASGLSASDLAVQMECDRAHISRIERGTAQPSLALAEKLAAYFGNAVTRDQILFPHLYEEKKKKPVRRASAESVAAHG